MGGDGACRRLQPPIRPVLCLCELARKGRLGQNRDAGCRGACEDRCIKGRESVGPRPAAVDVPPFPEQCPRTMPSVGLAIVVDAGLDGVPARNEEALWVVEQRKHVLL